MIIYEFRESVINNALDELATAKEGLKSSKKALCNIEDLLYELMDEDPVEELPEDEDDEPKDNEYEADIKGNDIDINYRNHSAWRNNMRMRKASAMRRNMRMRSKLSNRYTY